MSPLNPIINPVFSSFTTRAHQPSSDINAEILLQRYGGGGARALIPLAVRRTLSSCPPTRCTKREDRSDVVFNARGRTNLERD